MDVTRERAWETLTRYTKSESLLRHALAVEASTRWYARNFGEDEEFWGCAALLHDFDYEIHPTLDKHPQDGAPILREEGYPEELIDTVLSHAEHLAIPRDTLLMRTLFACDELSGFIHACGLVRPTGLEGLEPKSVRKKLKQPSFAAGVHRDEVYAGAALLVCRAAGRAGAGLVTLAVPESLQPLFAAKVVEATTMALPEDDLEEVDPELVSLPRRPRRSGRSPICGASGATCHARVA